MRWQQVKRKFRLTRSVDIQRVRRAGKSYAHPFVVLIANANRLDHVRIGVAAGRSVGNAVERNRAKRLLRAASNTLLPDLRTGFDLLLIARKPILEQKSPAVQKALADKLKQAGLLNTPATTTT